VSAIPEWSHWLSSRGSFNCRQPGDLIVADHSALHTPIHAELGGVLLANMLEGWRAGDPLILSTAETADEPPDCRTSLARVPQLIQDLPV
jgi:hypothetical protein